jgi:fatty acid desaturase
MFCAGPAPGSRAASATTATATRRLAAADPAQEDDLQPAILPSPDGIFLAIASVLSWITIIMLAGAFPVAATSPGPWQPLLTIVTLIPGVLLAAAIIRFVRWCRRRSRQAPHP